MLFLKYTIKVHPTCLSGCRREQSEANKMPILYSIDNKDENEGLLI
ncbi:hypothetical protein Q7O_003583 [Pectobacterium carotovorum subsp. carotovorum PCCS1]|nr:hypothetical protein [Pectobacterium carotovorum subsp. carotovorum PCCS1]